MKNFYNRYILPKYLSVVMKSEMFEEDRRTFVAKVSGIVAEIGFGTGLNLPYYKNVTKLYAIEPSGELFTYAETAIEKASFPVQYIQASAEKIPLESRSVDFVISTWTFCSISHPEIALAEVFRVLKPGGKFVFVEHGHSTYGFSAFLQNILTPFSKMIAGGCHLNRDIEKIILSAGFKIEGIEKYPRKGAPLNFVYKGVARVDK